MSTKGEMKVELQTSSGITLSKKHGFTVEEEDGQLVSFDYGEHPELGGMLLFGNQVFALKYWKSEYLDQALATLTEAVSREKYRRSVDVR